MSEQKVFTVIATKGEEPGVREGVDVPGLEQGYEVLSKDNLIERIKELTDEGYGYTILKAEKEL